MNLSRKDRALMRGEGLAAGELQHHDGDRETSPVNDIIEVMMA